MWKTLARDYGYDKIEILGRGALADVLGTEVYHGGGRWMKGRGISILCVMCWGWGGRRWMPGAVIYENTMVVKVEEGARPLIHTDKGCISAEHVIFACNGYLGRLNRKISRRVMPLNNFIVATAPLDGVNPTILKRDIAVADSRFVLNYFRRSHDNRLLFGGGEAMRFRFPCDIRAVVAPRLFAIYPQLKTIDLDYAWGGTLAITLNRMPCFMRLGKNMVSASGYSGHGVAMATLAGRLLAEATMGEAGGFSVMEKIKKPPFPGGDLLRHPLLVLGMNWYMLRDRLGF